MNCHAFYLALRNQGLDERLANRLVNGAKRHDLGDYMPTMLELLKHGAKVGAILKLCQWAKQKEIKPSWVGKRAALFSKHRALGDEMIIMEIQSQAIR